MGQESIQRIETGPQHAFDMVDSVEQFRIGLDLPPRQHLDRAGNADPRLVVAVDVSAHVELELVLLRIQKLPDLLGVADRIDAARDRARDRAGLDAPPVGAHEHLRRGRHQEFAVAEIHQRAVGRRIDAAQPLKHFRRRALAGFGEQLPGHRLEQIAAREGRARSLDSGLIFAGRVVGKSLPRRPGVNALRRFARQRFGRLALPGKIIAQYDAAPGGAVIGEQPIRHIEHDVALVFLPRALRYEVLDLEHEVVGEGAEQAEQRIIIGRKRRDQVAHQRHHAGAAGALVFLDRCCAAQDMAGETRRRLFGDDDAGLAQAIAEETDQNFTARVQGLQREIEPGGFQPQRRIGKAEIETLVAPRHVGARRQHDAAAAIQKLDQIIQPVGAASELLDRPQHGKAAAGAIFAPDRQ